MCKRNLSSLIANTFLSLLLSACGGNGSTALIGGSVAPGSYLIGGTVSGLPADEQVTLMNNGADDTTISSNGDFVFATPVLRNGAYSITVAAQPAGKTCTVSGGSGAGVTANVDSVVVICSQTVLYLTGTVTGLATGSSVTLLNNGADPTTVTANGAFTFATPVAYNGSYAVTVGTQPVGQTCTVSGGTGAGVTGAISNVSVTCSTNTFSVGGSVSGLGDGVQVTLLNNGADPTTVTANGAFTFSTPVAYNGSYAVTVGTQPIGQTCTVSGGTGAGVTGAISNVSVTCSTNTFSVGGSVSGLGDGVQVTLLNNGADPTTVTANGAFTFATPVAYNGSYAVTVGTQPVGQTCTVSGGTGAGVTGTVSGVAVTCSTDTFSVGGSVSGLGDGVQVTLLNNGADPTTVTANGAFTFATPVAYNGSYAVTVGTQPVGQTCTVSGGTGTGAGVTGAISNVAVTCSTNTFTVGGSVSGLGDGVQVTLLNNGADPTTVTGNGAFTFATPVAYNGSYAVIVGTQPVGQTCTVSGGTGAGVTGTVSGVAVTCSTDTFSVGGSVSGLGDGVQVTLLNNGANPTTVTANGAFTFATPVAYNGSYAVTVGTQPVGQTCTVSGGTGAGLTGAISNVAVTCSTDTFSVGGSVSGLGTGLQVTLLNNSADPTTVTANGAFTFSTPVSYNGSYAVTVGTQPVGQTCTVSGGMGAGVTGAISNVAVTCSTNTFTVGGSVSGLGSALQVTLLNNGSNATTVTANGAFTFSTPVAYGTNYAVTVGTNPVGQTCTVSSGTGTNITANTTAVSVSCSTDTFSVGGSVSGLASGVQVTLLDNGANPITVTANGGFTFSTPVAYGTNYAVTVGTQPTGQTCTVSGGTGSDVMANVTSVSVVCAAPTYTVSGTVTGLQYIAGSSFTLLNNSTLLNTYTSNGTYTFVTGVASGGSYSLTIGTISPNYLSCAITHASGSVTSNVTNVTISCVPP